MFDTLAETTIQGYHDKTNDGYYILKPDQHYLLTDNRHAPFLLTKNIFFTVETEEINRLIRSTKALKKFNFVKNLIAQVLVGIGLIAALAFVFLYISGTYTQLHLITAPLNILFWVSIIGAIILWHDFYRDLSHPVHLPKTELLDKTDRERIATQGIEFPKLQREHLIYYLSLPASEYIVRSLLSPTQPKTNSPEQQPEIFYFKLLQELLTNSEIKDLNKRLGNEFDLEKLQKHGVDKSTLISYPTTTLRSILVTALQEAIATESASIEPIHIFISMIRHFPVLTQYIKERELSIGIIRSGIRYYVLERKHNMRLHPLNPQTPYYRTGGIGRLWVYGYTFKLDKFTKDITRDIATSHDIFGIGHDNEVEQIIATLGRADNRNILLLGQPGVGKSSIIKGLAQQINWGTVPDVLRNKRILQLDINLLLAQSDRDKKTEKLLEEGFEEMKRAGNTILYIDEIQEILPAQSSDTGQNLAGIILPHIIQGDVPIIGTINQADYKKYFQDNTSLSSNFEVVTIQEPTPISTFEILSSKLKLLEAKHRLVITFQALVASIELAKRYIVNRKLPDSAVRTLQSACSWAELNNVHLLEAEHIANIVSKETKIPTIAVGQEQTVDLLKLEEKMLKQIIGQKEAVVALVQALKRAVADIRSSQKPIGVYLFLGPTGTGKTHVAKTLAKEYFQRDNAFIRIDMSEYQDPTDIVKIIGDPHNPTSTATTLTDKIKQNPFSVVLFDEIEKAHPQILDLFLQLFDEGRLSTATGETVSFNNTIIINTSNIGSDILLKTLEQDDAGDSAYSWSQITQRVLNKLHEKLRPELINRYDKVVIFKPHTKENLAKIAILLLNDLKQRLKDKNIDLRWEENVPQLLAEKTYDPGFGARPLRRYIQDEIETRLADEILTRGLSAGGEVTITPEWII